MKKSVLYVDDDPVSLSMGKETISRLGFQPLAASTGRAAAELIRRTLPDAILLDVVLPDCRGFDLAKKLKAHPRTQNIPIAFVTSLTDVRDFQEGFKSGGDIYLTKPFRPAALESLLLTLLGRS